MEHRFERPASVAEAARLLAAGACAVLAGGTDLYPAHVGRKIARAAARHHRHRRAARHPARRRVAGRSARPRPGRDVIRAELPPLFDALKAAAREIGGVQIQNTGTVAGNLCNASPAADGTPVLMALGASVVLQSARGERTLPLEQFVLGNRRTARAADELVVAVRVPARSAARALGVRQARRPPLPDDLGDDGRRRRRRRRRRHDRRRRRRGRQLLGRGAAPACARGAPASAHQRTATSPRCSRPATSRRSRRSTTCAPAPPTASMRPPRSLRRALQSVVAAP